ncbi:cardiolipin synthase ClsB [Ferrigenium sp. UT5]|uniref:cardiolipin synthase ClsB n=1 Tax=Ferrigenium sp. UT5 TaxID=3242105 RepID=UPI003551DDCA
MKDTFRVGGHSLTLLQNGERFFPQLCADIDAAQHAVHLETYIFAADETGRMVMQALQRAAQRQLAVRLVLDGFGSADLPQEWTDELRMAGVEVQWFRRERGQFRLRRHRLRRMHRKLAVVDSKIAYIGGINIINDIPESADIDMPRLDFAVRVQGRLVHEVEEAMRRLWFSLSRATLKKRIGHWRARLRTPDRSTGRAAVSLLLRDNLRHRHDIEQAYLQAIRQAEREIVLAHAYFLPGFALRHALQQAARRGVRVVLLLQGRVEYRLQHYATLALHGQLLRAGIEIYEYRASYLHAKVAVVDGQWATVGSSNLDPFSLLLAREANLSVRDEPFARDLRKQVLRAVKSDARRVEMVRRSPLVALLSLVSYGVIRMLVHLLVRQPH